MILRTAFMGMIMFATPTFANDLSPWFGSEASPPEQVSFAPSTTEQSVPAQVSVTTASLSAPLVCPIEGCKTAENLGKQPK
jgi:hypothetical protein